MKRQFIPRILNGDHIWCQFLSEPSGGSDLAGLLTRAELDGDTWRINGAKIWTTGGNYSDCAICLARTDPDVPKHAGITVFIVPMDTPGITVLPLRLTDGTADFCQEYLDDVVIPADYVIGEVHDGWRVATTLMMNERAAIGRGWSLAGRKGENEDAGIELDGDLLDLARKTGQRRRRARARPDRRKLGAQRGPGADRQAGRGGDAVGGASRPRSGALESHGRSHRGPSW